ncbi:hypothetical protein B0T24DRAFT_665970 [Lasiosphaeria ovina]|uniref:Fungal N-terminal domain-containing protein n=1 Tax=Lasiosphaeria ovina TaxID=92902 RepID=A0AAE0KJU9_9PEZI|nr:hypothetical protein B0T24DRAFT_665970 [Lasiosphaeria ovina]
MADPISIASGVASFVSLGIDICKGLKQYVSAYRDFDKDAKEVFAKLEGLQSSLALLGSALEGIEPFVSNNRAEILRQLEDTVAQCSTGLSKLLDYLERCGGETPTRSDDAVPTSTATGAETGGEANARGVSALSIRKRLNRAVKRSIYPLRKDTLAEISQNVDAVRSRIQFLLDILNLMLQNISLQRQSASDIVINSQSSSLRELKVDIQEVERRMLNIASRSAMQPNFALQEQLATGTLVRSQGTELQQMRVDIQRLDHHIMRTAWPLQTSPGTDSPEPQLSMVLMGFSRICDYFLGCIVYILLKAAQAFQRVPRSIMLLPTDCVHFEDMLGNTYRLQYSMARHWNVFEAYLRTEFGQRPGERFVNVGQYKVLHSRKRPYHMTLPKDQTGWYKELQPCAELVMSLQTAADDTASVGLKFCPRCQSALDSRGNDGIVELVECPTYGCWTGYRELATRMASNTDNTSDNQGTKLQELLYLKTRELQLFKRVHISEQAPEVRVEEPPDLTIHGEAEPVPEQSPSKRKKNMRSKQKLGRLILRLVPQWRVLTAATIAVISA